ncbi:MAG: penicillin-binding protein 2 [Candidatus Gracilibacteria bacterium]|nr:penicillin-binding protein 2 [Candidatus Gracilibacteria bacterium]
MKRQSILDNFINNRTIRSFINKCSKIHIIAAFFILCFLIIVFKMFSYTVFHFDFYKTLADKQQIGEVIVPVTRGNIYSSGERETILGTSLNLYDIAIDPKMDGDKDKLAYFLQEIVYKQICYLKKKRECKDNLTKFLKVLDIEDFENSETYIKKLLLEKMKERVNQTYVTSVLIKKDLSNQQINDVINLGIKGIYPSKNHIYANPLEIDNIPSVAEKLSPLLGYQKSDLEYILRKRELRYVPIFNKVSIYVSEYLKNYLDEEKEAIQKGILDINKSIYKFFILTPNPNRFYPENELAAQVMGFVDNQGVGHYGIEGQFNEILKGNNGKIVSRKDIMGRIIDPISIDKNDLLGEGVNIISTIDRNVQKKVEQVLEDGVKKYRANKGTIIVMEPKTGRIISMANYPTYDLNNFGDVYSLEKVKYSEFPNPSIDLLGYPIYVEDNTNGKLYYYNNKEIYLREAERTELGNKSLVKYRYKNYYGAQVYKNDAISSLYEPGSVMKSITVAVGLDTGEITRNSMYLDEGQVKIDQFTIKNIARQCLGYHTFGNALNYSCNVGMIRIVQRVGKVIMHQYFTDFGFGDVTNIDLSGEVYSKIRPWERWSTAQLLTSSYGLGVSVTPLQMAAAYNVLANGGVYVKPKIIEQIKFPDGKIINYKTEQERRVIKASTSKAITEMLTDGCINGVANNGAVEGYNLACKSGTAQIPYKGKYETGQGSTNGTFAGYGPSEDPRFVILVKLERIRTSSYGGETSGRLFADISKYLLDYYGIPKKVVTETKKTK